MPKVTPAFSVLPPELRPKGRGRPQRILTGSWPEDHVHGVIRAVVFRDPSSLPRHIDREDASKLTANRSAGVGRLLTPPSQSNVQVAACHAPEPRPAHRLPSCPRQAELAASPNIRGLIQSAMSNGNDAARRSLSIPSRDASFSACVGAGMIPGASAYSALRQMAGPSTANGIAELLSAPNAGNGAANNNNNVPGSMPAPNAPCLNAAALSTSSLFSALQQEVSDETRLAALNAMTQRIMSSLDGNFVRKAPL